MRLSELSVDLSTENELSNIHDDLESVTFKLQHQCSLEEMISSVETLLSHRNLNDELSVPYTMNMMRLPITEDNCLYTPLFYNRG